MAPNQQKIFDLIATQSHPRNQVIAPTQYGKSLTVALAVLCRAVGKGEKFKTEKNKLEIQILDLEKKIGKIDERMLKFAQESADKFDFAAHAKERFDNTEDLKVKHDILSKLGSNLNLKGRKIYYDSPNFFVTIKNIKADEPIIGRSFEPGYQGYTKPQLEALYASSPTVLRGGESDSLPQDYAPSCITTRVGLYHPRTRFGAGSGV